MASEWAQQRLRKWLDEVIDINKRQIGFRIPELLDEVRRETAARCAVIARYSVGPASHIRREFGLEEWKEG